MCLKVLKVKSVFYVYAPMVYKFFWCLVMMKMVIQIASMKTPTNFEDTYWNLLQIACFGIQEAACDSVNCSVSRGWWWRSQKFLKRVSESLFKSQEGDWLSAFSKAELRFPILFEVLPELEIAASCKIYRISTVPVSVFIEASKNLKSIFLNN